MDTSTIGRRIRLLRTSENISMDELAKRVSIPSKEDPSVMKPISSAAISNIENGKHLPSAEVIIALSDYFDVSTDWLLKGKDHNKSALQYVREVATEYLAVPVNKIPDIEKVKELTSLLKEQSEELISTTGVVHKVYDYLELQVKNMEQQLKHSLKQDD